LSNDEVLTLLVIMVAGLLILALVAGIAVVFVAVRWLRGRSGKSNTRSSTAGEAVSAATPAPPRAAPVRKELLRFDSVRSNLVSHGDVPADDPRIIALGLEPPASTEAVFRNLEKVKSILREESAESDRIGRTTPLAGGALRATGVFQWCFPTNRGGLDASFSDRLEAVTQVARIDAGMAWVVTWLSAHGDITGRLDDESYAELYPSIDLPTAFSAAPMARAVEIADDKYRIEEATWKFGSGGYHAERWIAGAKVWDAAGQPVIDDLTGVQKAIGIWLPVDKVRQAHDWDPLGVRSSGSASYFLTEPVDVSRRWAFNMGADLRPYFFPFMGVLVGMAQHLIDLALEALRAKRRSGIAVGAYDRTVLTEAMSSLDMLVFGLRGHALYLDRVLNKRESRSITPEESAWVHSAGLSVRLAVMRIRDITADIYGTGYVSANSEFGHVLRDIQVALAHGWFRLSDTQTDRGWRVAKMLDDPAVTPNWDAGWHVKKLASEQV
jgi:hypothetical protein